MCFTLSTQYATLHYAVHVKKQPTPSHPRYEFKGKVEIDFQIIQQSPSLPIPITISNESNPHTHTFPANEKVA